MIKQTIFAASLMVSAVALATETTATKESCEAAIAAHETAADHNKDAVEAAKAALAKHDFDACVKALEEHKKAEEKK